jgi:hypothetical protein
MLKQETQKHDIEKEKKELKVQMGILLGLGFGLSLMFYTITMLTNPFPAPTA